MSASGSPVPDKDELFELLIESASDFAIFTTDPRGLVTSWNSGAERLFGFAEHQMLGQPADVIFTLEDQKAGRPQQEREDALRHGRALDDRWHQRIDGSRFWASGLLMPLRRQEEGFVKITRDRTEQHETVERLRENEERFRLLATSIPQLVFRTLYDGTRIWGSPQWIEFTGLNQESSLDLGWLDAIRPEDRAITREAWTRARETGEYYVEHRVRSQKTGEYRWHQTRARPVQVEGAVEGDWVGSMTDIHELKMLHGRQQVMMAELLHRTRNLLAVVQAVALQTAGSASSLEEYTTNFMSRLKSLGRAQDLIVRAEDESIDMRQLLEAELSAHTGGALETEKIRLDGPPVLLPTITIQTLALALHELTTNAVKYGALAHPHGRLSVSWNVEPEDEPRRLQLRWAESGVRMPADPTNVRRGYGSTLIERALPLQLNASTRLEWGTDGVKCEIGIPFTPPSSSRVH